MDFYSSRIKLAIDFAARTHAHQIRKSTGVPYIVHPLAVFSMVACALRVSQLGDDYEASNIMVAALLHDTIEDSLPDDPVTRESLCEEFGEQVAEIVDQMSIRKDGRTWKERKCAGIQKIKGMLWGAMLVKAADCIANMTDFICQYRRKEDAILKDFGADKADQLWNFDETYLALRDNWSDNPLLPDYVACLEELRELWQGEDPTKSSASRGAKD